MSLYSKLSTAMAEPHEIPRYLNEAYHTGGFRREHNPDGIDFFEADWDNLVILDACRLDSFRELADLPGELETRTSRAASTPEFVASNLAGKRLHDTVYVTANGYVSSLREEFGYGFHHLENLFEERYWDDEFATVLPETTTEAAIEVADAYPNKRLVAHYIQPHWPFVGPTARRAFGDVSNYDDRNTNVWEQIRAGAIDVSDEALRRAYRETLERALSSVERLVAELDGRTVVTADHGQLLGHRVSPVPIKEYGHPDRLYVPDLVEVPWQVIDGERREIVSEGSASGTSVADGDVVRQRLNQLGYVE